MIVFMGNEAGAGVTGNMISIALALASEMNCTITLFENHAGNNGIMNYLKPHENVNCVCEEDYLSSLYRNSLTRNKSEYTFEEIIQSMRINVIKLRLKMTKPPSSKNSMLI